MLDALGIRIDHDAASASAALAEIGFAFMFAPNFHPAMKHAGPTRREIGVRTAFNLVGPLTNPAGTTRQLLGVADPAAAGRIAEVAQRLGTERTFVIRVKNGVAEWVNVGRGARTRSCSGGGSAITSYESGGPAWDGLVQRGMAVDFDWTTGSAPRYVEAYERAIRIRRESR